MSEVPGIGLNDGAIIPQVGLGVFLIPPEDTPQAVGTALEAGYRHIDTAQMYGNEEGVGRGIKDSGLPRGDVFVTTKLTNRSHGYDSAMRELDASLQRLSFDYVDLYLIHWPVPRKDRTGLEDETIRNLAEKHGKTPAQVILRWHIQLGTIAIPKSASPSPIRENLDVSDIELADEDMDRLAWPDTGTRVGPDPGTFG